MHKKTIKNLIAAALCGCMMLSFTACADKTDNVDNNITTTEKSVTTTAPEETREQTEKETTTETETTKETETTVRTGPKLVAITFDDGPYSPVTERILDTLEKYNVKATFYVVGNRIKLYEKSLKRASDMGCEIGSHTYTHTDLTTLTVPEIREEIDKSVAEITRVTGKGVKTVRPPGGAVNDAVREGVDYPLIMWSVDSKDWYHREAGADYSEVMDYVYDGCIILMHDLYPASADAAERIIPDLLARGYKFVTVSELFELRGVNAEKGIRYYSAK